MNDVTVRWIVKGRVQGVGFRYYTVRAATALGLHGTVRNRADGSVEVDACGPPEVLDALLVRLRAGPSSAVVLEIDDTETAAASLPERFEMRF